MNSEGRATFTRNLLAVVIIALVVFGLGLAAGRWRWRREGRLHIPAREVVIRAQARQIAPGQMVVVGDSIVERIRLGSLCGLDALNVGISDARVRDMSSIADVAARIAKPSKIVVALGTNDLADAGPISAFEASYGGLLDELHPSMVVGIGDRGEAALRARQNAMNAFIQGEAARRGIAYVPPLDGAMLAADHIHPSPAGATAWRAAVDQRCSGR